MRIQLELDDEMAAAVDAARGDVARVVWIRRAIEQRLGARRFEGSTSADPTRKRITGSLDRKFVEPRPKEGK